MKNNIHQVFTFTFPASNNAIIENRNEFFANIFNESTDYSSNFPLKFFNCPWIILVNL